MTYPLISFVAHKEMKHYKMRGNGREAPNEAPTMPKSTKMHPHIIYVINLNCVSSSVLVQVQFAVVS